VSSLLPSATFTADVSQALIYPGLGRGTILSKANFMTDKMIVAGANRLAELAPAMKDHTQALLPDFGGEYRSGPMFGCPR
jgi:malate dehydrogenase (oxaloacetate-decarboxylating)